MKYETKCKWCDAEYSVLEAKPNRCTICGSTFIEVEQEVEMTEEWLKEQDCSAPEGAPNINTITAEELHKIAHIGITRANNIVMERGFKGRIYRHAADLLRVRNIGVHTAASLIGKVSFENPPKEEPSQSKSSKREGVYCPECGERLRENDQGILVRKGFCFCFYCGSLIETEAEE